MDSEVKNVLEKHKSNDKEGIAAVIITVLFLSLMYFFFQLEKGGMVGCILTPIIYLAVIAFFITLSSTSERRVNSVLQPLPLSDANSLNINISDFDKFIRSEKRKLVGTFLVMSVGALVLICTSVYMNFYGPQSVDTTDNDRIFDSLLFLVLGVIFALCAFSTFIMHKNLDNEIQAIRASGNYGMIMFSSKISIISITLKTPERKKLWKSGKATIDINWEDIEKIRVEEGDESPRVYSFVIKKSSDLYKTLPFYWRSIEVERQAFFGQEKEVIAAFHKFAKCPIEINDKIY